MIMFKTRDKFEIELHIESNGDYCFRQSFNLWKKKQICGLLINSSDALLVQRGLHKTMEYECTKPHKNQSAIPVNSDD